MSVRKLLRTVQAEVPGGGRAGRAGKRAFRRALRRDYEPGLAVLRLLPSGAGPVIDVGANHGQSTDAMRRLRPDLDVEAFEANPWLGRALARRYSQAPGVTVHPFGLGAAPGEFTLHIPVYGHHTFDGLAALHEDDAQRALEGWIYRYTPRRLSIRAVTCRLGRLDDQGLEPSFVKIDVEGHESAVLNGARATLERHEPIVMIETDDADSEVTGLLGALGYRRVSLAELLPETRRTEHNWIFITPARRESLA